MNVISLGTRLAASAIRKTSLNVFTSKHAPSVLPTTRNYAGTSTTSSPLDQFRDAASRETRSTDLVGRSWSVKELRRKSFDDLHKLWYILYKEKNMLLTESNICRQNSVYFPQNERKKKVKKSMAAIKVVLGERKREKIAQAALRALEKSESELESLEDNLKN